VPERLRR